MYIICIERQEDLDRGLPDGHPRKSTAWKIKKMKAIEASKNRQNRRMFNRPNLRRNSSFHERDYRGRAIMWQRAKVENEQTSGMEAEAVNTQNQLKEFNADDLNGVEQFDDDYWASDDDSDSDNSTNAKLTPEQLECILQETELEEMQYEEWYQRDVDERWREVRLMEHEDIIAYIRETSDKRLADSQHARRVLLEQIYRPVEKIDFGVNKVPLPEIVFQATFEGGEFVRKKHNPPTSENHYHVHSSVVRGAAHGLPERIRPPNYFNLSSAVQVGGTLATEYDFLPGVIGGGIEIDPVSNINNQGINSRGEVNTWGKTQISTAEVDTTAAQVDSQAETRTGYLTIATDTEERPTIQFPTLTRLTRPVSAPKMKPIISSGIVYKREFNDLLYTF